MYPSSSRPRRVARFAGMLVASLCLIAGSSAQAAESTLVQPVMYSHTKMTESTQWIVFPQTDLTSFMEQLNTLYGSNNLPLPAGLINTSSSEYPELDRQLAPSDDSKPDPSTDEPTGSPVVVGRTDRTRTDDGGTGGAGSVAESVLTTLRLSEIYPNTTGSDTEEEFIELKNIGNQTVSLVGWKLEDATEKPVTLSQDLSVQAGGYIALPRSTNKLSLNNDADTVRLISPDGTTIDAVAYESSIEGSTLSHVDGTWMWTDMRTPGATNQRGSVIENEPIASTVESSIKPTVVTIALEQPAVTRPIVETQPATAPESIVEPTPSPQPLVKTLRISEVYPNTGGNDLEEEFIELENVGTDQIALTGWKLPDASAKTYTLNEGTLQPSEFLILDRTTTKISLNNDEETLTLNSPDDEVIDAVTYNNTTAQHSFSRMNGAFVWTQPSAGQKNIAPVVQEVLAPAVSSATTNDATRTSDDATPQAWSSSLDAIDGTQVLVEGIALVAPGVYGKQIFYLSVDGHGIQVFKNDASFPAIVAGARVKVRGELSTSRDERRIKVAKDGVLEILEAPIALQPSPRTIGDITTDQHGNLVTTQGQVVTRSNDQITIEQDGVPLTIAISEYANIDTSLFAKGDRLRTTGVVVSQTGSIKLKPRSQSDLEKLESPITATVAQTEPTGKEQERSTQIHKAIYLSAATGLILLALIVRKHLPKLSTLYARKNSLAVTTQDVR